MERGGNGGQAGDVGGWVIRLLRGAENSGTGGTTSFEKKGAGCGQSKIPSKTLVGRRRGSKRKPRKEMVNGEAVTRRGPYGV